MTTACPTGDDLRALLDDRLAADSEPGVLAHIDACARCQRALETLTAGDLPSAVLLARSTRAEPRGTVGPPAPGPDRGHPDRIGPYRVCRELGRGGMGVVYLGTHTRLRREAAVKLIRAGASARPEDVARFRREAEAVAAVAHPNVVAVYDSGEQDDVPWLALEYVPGGSLREHLGGRPLRPRVAAEIARGLARGASAVHAVGVVHRDIKPANVMLAPAGGAMVPKLTDFGLAKDIVGAGVTLSGTVLGTPHYMAPEQARVGGAIGPTTDVYGIGAVLYETLTGSPPFNGADPAVVLHQVVTRDPVPARHLQPAVPRDLQTICHKCLEKEPARRYPTAEALAEDLSRFLDGRPILARPVGPVGAGWRLARRHPVPSALLAALAVAVAAGVGGVGWKWREAAAERDKTAAAERDTAAERDAAVAARTAARRHSALALLDKGIAAAEAGRVGEGVVWMAEALAVAPPGDESLDRVVRMNLAGWRPHAPRVRAVSPLPRGEAPIGLAPDGRALLARAADGRLRYHPLDPGGPPIDLGVGPHQSIAVCADGRFVLVVTEDKDRREWLFVGWDVASRRAIEPAYRTRAAPASVVPAPTGTTAAVALSDGQVFVFDLATNRPVFAPTRHPHKRDRVTALAFAPGGKAVFTWTDDPRDPDEPDAAGARKGPAAHTWEAATGVRSDARYGGGVVRQAAFSPRGDRLVTVAPDGTARLWDTAAGEPVGAPLPSAGDVATLVFSTDGRYAVLVTNSGLTRWWDTARGELVAPPTVGPVTWLGFRPDGIGFVTVDDAGEPIASVWELPRGQARPARLPAPRADAARDHSAPRAAADPSMKVVVTGGYLAPPRVWDVGADRPAPVPLRLLGRNVSAVAASTDGGVLAAAALDDDPFTTEVFVWDSATGRPAARIPHLNWVRGMGFTPDGRVLVTGGYDRHVHTWEPATGRRLGAPTRVGEIVFGLEINPAGRAVALSRSPGRGMIGPAVLELGGDPAAPSVREAWADRDGTRAEVVRFTPDGAHVVGHFPGELHSLGYRSEVRRWDARTGQPAGPSISVYRVRTAAPSADGRTALVGSGDGTARVWDLATGHPVGLPLAHPSAVNACDLHAGAGLAVCGCDDGSARVWDLATGRPVGPPLTHGPALTAVAFVPDGRAVRTVADDGSVRTWAIPEPTAGEPDLVRRAVARRTLLALDPGQRVVPLTAAAWAVTKSADLPDETLSVSQWHAARARDAEADGAWAVAAYHLDQLLAAPSGDPTELFCRRARCESAVGKFSEAAARYARAAAPAVQLAEWYVNRAIESGTRGQWAIAAWYVERVATHRPDDPDVPVARAEAQSHLRNAEAWPAAVARAVPVAAPAEVRRWANRAAVLGRWELAADLSAPPAGAARLDLYYREAVARLKAGDAAGYARVCKRVEALVRADWTVEQLNPAVWLLSLAPGGMTDPDRVVQLFAPAVARVENPARFHDYANTLGAALLRAGRYEEAIRWIERGITAEREAAGRGGAAARSFPEDAALLALAHRRLGDNERADARLAEAREAAAADAPRGVIWWPDRAAREVLIAEASAPVPPAEPAPPPRPRAPGLTER